MNSTHFRFVQRFLVASGVALLGCVPLSAAPFSTTPPSDSRLHGSQSGAPLLVAAGPANPEFALRPNERVVFYGDSITDQRLYTTFVETFVVTRFPGLPISFVNSGWSGDRATGGNGGPVDLRLQRDVLPFKPTLMTIMLGMNDGGSKPFDQTSFDTYARGITHILDTVQKAEPDVRFTLIQPSPYDDVTRAPKFEGGYNAVLRRFGGFLGTTAAQRNLGLADLNTPVVEMLGRAKAANPTLAQKIIPDRVHPGPAGHLIMAEALLKAWHAPSLVSDVAIDAATGRVVNAQNTQVSGLTIKDDAASWTQNDACLPFPLDLNDAVVALAVNASDFVPALDREPLRVMGLPAPRYTLFIDGDDVADLRREELAAGVNLAQLPTPMRAQALAVHRLTLQHNDQHFARWRTFQVPYANHSAVVQNALPAFLAALDSEEAETIARQRALAQPKPHLFQLSIAQPEPTGINLALHKSYTSTDLNLSDFGTGGLTDGSWSGEAPHTFGSGQLNAFPKSATIDLGSAMPIAQVRTGIPTFGSTKTVKVSLSADGQNFSEAGSHTFALASGRRHLFTFAPQSARYVRFTFPDHYEENVGYAPSFVFLSEAEVYGPTL